jgi:hypothetical protein
VAKNRVTLAGRTLGGKPAMGDFRLKPVSGLRIYTLFTLRVDNIVDKAIDKSSEARKSSALLACPKKQQNN